MKLNNFVLFVCFCFFSSSSVANGAIFRRNPYKPAIELRRHNGDALEKEIYERNL